MHFESPWAQLSQQFEFDPAVLSELQQNYLAQTQTLWAQGLQAHPVVGDRRFASDAWAHNPVACFSAEQYLLNARTLMQMADALQGDAKAKAKVRFALEQWLAATAPTNYMAFNVDAQQKAIDSQGASIGKGIQNLLADIQQGHMSMTDESQFEIGRNVPPPKAQWCLKTIFFS